MKSRPIKTREFTNFDIQRALKALYALPDDTSISFETINGELVGATGRFVGDLVTDPNKVMREDIVSMRALMVEENRARKQEHNEMLVRLKDAMRPKPSQEVSELDYSQLETRIAASLADFQTRVRRDTRGECKKLRVKVREDAEEISEENASTVSQAWARRVESRFGGLSAELGQVIVAACQKALQAQVGAMRDAASRLASKDNKQLPLHTPVRIVNSAAWAERIGMVAAYPDAPDGFKSGQYRVQLEGGGAIWARRHQLEELPEDKRPIYAELVYGCLGRVAEFNRSSADDEGTCRIDTERGKANLVKRSHAIWIKGDLNCRCCGKPIVNSGRGTPGLKEARVLNTRAMLGGTLKRVRARCGDCKLEGSYRVVSGDKIDDDDKRGLAIGDLVTDGRSLTGKIREFIMFHDGDWGALVFRNPNSKHSIPLTKLTRKSA